MADFSTRQAAKKLGIGASTLSRYIADKKIPAPKSVTTGGITVHVWSEDDIERVRKLLPKIENGRKTRYKKEEKQPKRKKKS
jgi:excisionase family DNA binding protein